MNLLNKNEFENLLKSKYPSFLKYLNAPDIFEPIAQRGIEIRKGWYKILDKLCAQIEQNYSEIYATQIKEKFGKLTVYIQHTLKDNQDLNPFYASLKRAEEEASQTCEICSTFGELKTNRHRLEVLCKNCEEIK